MLGKKHNFHLRGIYFNKFPSSRFWFSSGNKAKFTKPIWSCFPPTNQWQNMRFKSNFKYRLNVFQSQANQNVTDSKQTISNHMQAARCLLLLLLLVLVLSLLLLVSRRYKTTCKRRGAYYRRTPNPRSKAWLLLMHDSRAYQCDIECEVSTQYVFVTRVCRVRMMTRLTHRLHNKASHHLCDECLLPATRQSTALMIAEVDFSKLWQFIFLPHLNYFVVMALHCTHTHTWYWAINQGYKARLWFTSAINLSI